MRKRLWPFVTKIVSVHSRLYRTDTRTDSMIFYIKKKKKNQKEKKNLLLYARVKNTDDFGGGTKRRRERVRTRRIPLRFVRVSWRTGHTARTSAERTFGIRRLGFGVRWTHSGESSDETLGLRNNERGGVVSVWRAARIDRQGVGTIGSKRVILVSDRSTLSRLSFTRSRIDRWRKYIIYITRRYFVRKCNVRK